MRNKSQKSRNYEVLRRIQVLVLTIVLFTMNLMPIKVQAATTIQNVESIDFTNFSNWRSGCYNWTDGKYMENAYRLCLKDYVTFSGTKYKVHVTEGVYHILIRELDSNKNFLRTSNLSNGQEYIPGSGAKYLGISIYKSDWETCMSYATYQSKFAKGFVAELVRVQDSSSNVSNSNSSTGTTDTILSDDIISDNITSSGSAVADDTSEYYAIDTLNLNDFDNWRSGYYNYTNGKYDASMTTRICLNKYATFSSSSYKISISNTAYHLLIREMDSDMKFVKSYNLANGATYTPGSSAKYLGISLYKVSSESGLSYATFKQLFANGFTVSMDTGNNSAIKEDTVNSVQGFSSLKEEITDMLETGEMGTRDVSKYNKSFSQVYMTFDSLINNECYLAYMTTYGVVLRTTKNDAGIVQTVSFENMDADFPTRYVSMKKVIQEAKSLVQAGMKDVEKALVLHDFMLERMKYVSGATGASYASAALVNGKCICSGYANGLRVLLHEVGIENYYISGNSGTHGWLMAELDGYWYHIDPTWDDTKTRIAGEVDHRYFVRNDKEFKGLSHSNWASYEFDATSTSEKYTDWFVHDVVGKMYYNKGLWYYYDSDSNSIMSSNIDGTNQKVVVNGSINSDKIHIDNVEDNIMTYSVGDKTYTKTL